MQQRWSCKNKIPSFAARFRLLNVGELAISDYSKRYLAHLQQHHLYYLAIYAEVLDHVVEYKQETIANLTLVDYGAGNGLLGIFAKHCGARQVIVCDHDAGFVHAARLTASALDVDVDRYVTGDIEMLALVMEGITVDAIAGTDVIEHIYNLDLFFSAIKGMNENMVTVFTTASNPGNIFKVRYLKRLQLKDELEGSDPADFVLAGAEPHESFLQMREKIIRANFPALTAEQYNLLAKQTRGLKKEDIINACARFLSTAELPVPEKNSTNTCHPITGSWTERILSLSEYTRLYSKYGFALRVKSGFYNSYGTGTKKAVNKILNFVVKLTGKNTAPFITLIGFKTT